MVDFWSLVRYEWKKLWDRKITVIFLISSSIFLSAAMLLSYIGSGYEYHYDAQDQSVERCPAPYLEVERTRREYMMQFSGEVLDDNLIKLLSENYSDSTLGTKQWNLNDYAPFRYLNTLSDLDSASADDYYCVDGFLAWLGECHATDDEISYWSQKADQLEPISLDYCGGWFAMIQYSGLLSLLTVLVVGISLCSLFPDEHKLRMDQLILSSRNGRLPLFLSKLIVGISFAVFVPVILYGVQLIVCGALFGLHGFSAPLRLWADGNMLWDCTVGEYSLAMLGLLALAAVMLEALVLLVSEATNSAAIAVAAPFALASVPLLGFFSQTNHSIEKIVNYLPTLRISIKTLEDYHLICFGGLTLNCLVFSTILYLLLCMLFSVLCGQFYRHYQVTGR